MQVIKIRGPLDGSACKSAAASVGFAHLWLSGGGTFFFLKKKNSFFQTVQLSFPEFCSL